MVIAPSLMHNRFTKVTIPKACELVRAYGLNHQGSQYSGDDYIKTDASKIDNVKEVAKEAFEPDSQ